MPGTRDASGTDRHCPVAAVPLTTRHPSLLPTPPLQLHLPIELIREPTLDDYLVGSNGAAVAALRAAANGHGEPFLFLFGLPGTGKTHLLQGACLSAHQTGRRAHFIPLDHPGRSLAMLEGLERMDLVAVDDVDQISGDPDWEFALFDLFNRLREQGRALLTSAAAPPDALPLGLEDLRSRLQWGPRYQILPLTETQCEDLLVDTARRRGLVLGPEVVRYIMTYHPRDPGSLLDLVARVDVASLREQHKPTIPLVRRVMRQTDQTNAD